MNRPIKFKAYDTANKQWERVSAVADIDNTGVLYLAEIKTKYDFKKPEIILMQFTGLHDKNGQEIYEGDTVTDGQGFGIVCSEDWLEIGIDEIEGQPKIYEDYANRMEKWYLLEIIGNIYENPELLRKHEEKV